MQEELSKNWDAILVLATEYGFDLLAGIATLVFGWWLAGRAKKLMLAGLDRVPAIDETLKPFFASIVRYAIIAITLVAVLARLGIQTTSIIAVLGAAGLAIGLALQGTLQNIAAGIMLLILRPFKVGDYIDAGGTAGTVDEIGLFTTDMTTFDGIYLSVPNSALWNTSILNYTRLPTRRHPAKSHSRAISESYAVPKQKRWPRWLPKTGQQTIPGRTVSRSRKQPEWHRSQPPSSRPPTI